MIWQKKMKIIYATSYEKLLYCLKNEINYPYGIEIIEYEDPFVKDVIITKEKVLIFEGHLSLAPLSPQDNGLGQVAIGTGCRSIVFRNNDLKTFIENFKVNFLDELEKYSEDNNGIK